MSPAPDDPPLELPGGYGFVRVLARRPGIAVVEAERAGERLVLRIEEEGREGLAELAVLAAVEHPGIARLVDFGVAPGGGSFVSRSWIEGTELAGLRGQRTPEELGHIVVRLCDALEHLHARGFVHADLKASNVIVQDGDVPVLTDFGMSLRARSGETDGRVTGSLFHIAPEVLLGRAPDRRADLFALGVLVHDLLVGNPADARAFYGEFPARSFLDAVGTPLASVPEWARDPLDRLLARDPARRLASAAEAGRLFAVRLGMAAPKSAARPSLRWPVLRGREGFLAERIAALRTGRPGRVQRWTTRGDDAGALAVEVAIQISLAGIRARSIDLGAAVDALGSSRALDQWARRLLDDCARGVLVVPSAGTDRWRRRAVDWLASVAARRARSGAETTLVICARAGDPTPETPATAYNWPDIAEASIQDFLSAELEGDQIESLAARLHAECAGSAVVLQGLLDEIAGSDWLRPGKSRPALRPGELPAWLGRSRGGRSERARPHLGLEARDLLAALIVLGGEASLERTARLAGSPRDRLPDAFDELVTEEQVRVSAHDGGDLALEVVGSNAEGASLGVPEQHWRALHQEAARVLEHEGAERRQVLPHLYRARPDDAVSEQVHREARALRELGCPELAIALLVRVSEIARAAGRAPELEVSGELALALASVGELDRAASLADSLGAEPDGQALAERVRGQVATFQQRHAQALEHFEHSVALSAEGAEDALVAKARLLYETGDDAGLEQLVADLDRARYGPLSRRLDVNVHACAAMAAFRRGETESARATLTQSLTTAQALEDPLREAVVRINLGIVERRTGSLQTAVAHFEWARSSYEDVGFLPGVAQTHSLLGSAQRELGELVEADALLSTADELFESLGDRNGAAAARGMLGLVRMERGHLRAALDELVAALPTLSGAPAGMVQARIMEIDARMGRTSEVERPTPEVAQVEPRIDVALARAAWFGGDADRALELARGALERAGELRLAAPRDEASLLIAALTGKPLADPGSMLPAVCEDARILELLGATETSFDGAEALALACALAERGRDDRAARVFAALAHRSADQELQAQATDQARSCFEACAKGLTADEAEQLSHTLLGFPDPWPEDLTALTAEGEWEMDVMSVLDINRRLVEQQELPELLGAIVDHALEVTGAERGFLVLEEDGELHLDLALDSRRGDIDEPEVQMSRSITRHVLETGQVLRLSNASDDPVLGAAPSVSALELRSILCQPFEVDESVRGVIYLDNRIRSGVFSDRAERLLGLLADQAALAIRQVRRLDEIRRLNAELNQKVVVKETDLRAARRALVDAGVTVPVGGLVGDSQPMKRVHDLLRRLAGNKLPILVCGSSGTGKELAARALHDLSPWSAGPFVSENCAALPASLIESELFGYSKGTFTGAEQDRAGLFERSGGGTLFLDEIGELPIELQAKLLRVLETREVRRLGEAETRKIDFRLVAATNRDLAHEADEGRFRADLYYRLDGMRLDMPAIAERVEDVPALVDHFLRLEASKDGVERRCAPEVLLRLCERAWPGNVREIANEVARLCVLSTGDLVDPDLVRAPHSPASSTAPVPLVPLADLERRAIEDALARTNGDKRRAAELLGISRAKIYQRLKEWRDVTD